MSANSSITNVILTICLTLLVGGLLTGHSVSAQEETATQPCSHSIKALYGLCQGLAQRPQTNPPSDETPHVYQPQTALPNSLLAAGEVDASFNTSAGRIGFVFAVVVQPDGKILLGGMFDNINGIPRNSLARLNADGSLDATFNPGEGVAGGFVLSLALQPDGKILAGGLFSSINEIGRNNIARLNADGSVDETFNPGAGTNERVIAFAVQPDGKIVRLFGNDCASSR